MKNIMLNKNLIDRVELLEIVDQEFPGGIGVEIGVASGCFTKQILATWKSLGELYCIDLWAHQSENYYDSCNLSDNVQKDRYQQFLKDFSGLKIQVIKDWSHMAVNKFEDNSIDFLYLDANHSYAPCLQDINLWYPKVKIGGVLSGHDYYNGDDKGAGVKKAVDEFALKNNITIFKTLNEYSRPEAVYGVSWEGPSWFFRKK